MYEYKVLQANTLISEDQINELASMGWRLADIAFDPKVRLFYFYLERRKFESENKK